MLNPLLSDQEAQFVNQYLVLGKATEAARRAGYSESFAKKKAYQLLKREAVREAIAAGTLIENQEELALSRRQAVSVLSAMVLATPDMLMDPEDGLAIFSTSGVYKQAIREFSQVIDAKGMMRRTTLKFWNKVSAIRELRMLGALEMAEDAAGRDQESREGLEDDDDLAELARECAACSGVDTSVSWGGGEEGDPAGAGGDLPGDLPTYREADEADCVSDCECMSCDDEEGDEDFDGVGEDLPTEEEMEELRRMIEAERFREAYRVSQRLRGEVVSEDE